MINLHIRVPASNRLGKSNKKFKVVKLGLNFSLGLLQGGQVLKKQALYGDKPSEMGKSKLLKEYIFPEMTGKTYSPVKFDQPVKFVQPRFTFRNI